MTAAHQGIGRGFAEYAEMVMPQAVILLMIAAGCALVIRRYFKADGSQRSNDEMVDRISWGTATFLLSLVLLAATHPLIRGLATGKWDAEGQFFPYFALVSDHIKHGQLVSWDLWTNAGAPLMGDPQAGALSPIVLAFGLVAVHPSQGFVAYWLFSWWLGGLGMLCLGRHFGAPVWGSFVVAIGFLFCGIYMGHAEHTPWIVGFSLVPWIIWRLDFAVRNGSYLAALQAGAIWGLQGLASHPSVVLVTACYAVLWVVGLVLFPQQAELKERPTFVRALLMTQILLVTGAVIFSPTYASFFFDGAGVHNRTGALDRGVALSDEFPPGALATLASPYLTIVKFKEGLWQSTDVSMVNAYVGVFIPLAALLGLVLRPKSPWRWWLAGLAVLSFLCAMGETLPLRGWLYDVLPPMRYFRHSAVFRLFAVFSMAALALAAVRDVESLLSDSSHSKRRVILVTTAASCILVIAALVSVAFTRPLTINLLVAILHPALVWGALLLLACFVYLSGSVARRSAAILLLLGLAISDALVTGILSTPTVMSFGSHRWRELDATHVGGLDQTALGMFRKFSACEVRPPDGRCRRNDQMITKVPVLEGYSSDKSPWVIATAQDPVLRASAIGSNRVWFTPVETVAETTDADFAAFRSRAHSLTRVPIVLNEVGEPAIDARGSRSFTPPIANAPAAVQMPARILTYSPQQLVLDVVSPTAGWLLVTDRWSPRWSVTVNGKVQRNHLANFIFRAVKLERGNNRVRYQYAPWGFPWLLLISWALLLATAASTISAILAGRTRR